MFSVGQFVVKANTGICKIDSITLIDHGTGEREYYILRPVDDVKSTLYIGTDVDDCRLRSVMERETALSFLETVCGIEAATVQTEKLREQTYKDAMKSNDPSELVKIIKNLYVRGCERMAQGKKVAATDDKYYKAAERALCSELAFVLEREYDEIKELIREMIKA